MSVHSYRAIEQWVAQYRSTRAKKTSFSYLNPRKLEMVFDPKDPGSGEEEKPEFIGQSIELKFNDFLNLHGWIAKPFNTNPTYLNTAIHLVSRIKNNSWDEWEKWIIDDFRKQTRREDRPENRKNKTNLKQTLLTLPEGLTDFMECLKLELNFNIGQSIFNNVQEPEDLCKWLEGLWLEHYLLGELQRIANDTNLHDIGQNINLNKKIDNQKVDFELDAIAVCGYQLFAFSCTTDNKDNMLKLKLFEVFMRARQLGGDEARVALVCCSKDPQKVEREARQDVDTEGRIKVFGLQDLPDLANKLKMWIKEQSLQNQ